MGLLPPVLMAAVGLLVAWKAEALGKALRSADGGRLERELPDLSGDARAYSFFVRLAGMMLFLLGAAILAVNLARSVFS